MTTLNGKVALVTGASRGIGAAVARRLAEEVSSWDLRRAAATTSALRARSPSPATFAMPLKWKRLCPPP